MRGVGWVGGGWAASSVHGSAGDAILSAWCVRKSLHPRRWAVGGRVCHLGPCGRGEEAAGGAGVNLSAYTVGVGGTAEETLGRIVSSLFPSLSA
jgi:hypothetical protein